MVRIGRTLSDKAQRAEYQKLVDVLDRAFENYPPERLVGFLRALCEKRVHTYRAARERADPRLTGVFDQLVRSHEAYDETLSLCCAELQAISRREFGDSSVDEALDALTPAERKSLKEFLRERITVSFDDEDDKGVKH